jgi:hypothetical protein
MERVKLGSLFGAFFGCSAGRIDYRIIGPIVETLSQSPIMVNLGSFAYLQFTRSRKLVILAEPVSPETFFVAGIFVNVLGTAPSEPCLVARLAPFAS